MIATFSGCASCGHLLPRNLVVEAISKCLAPSKLQSGIGGDRGASFLGFEGVSEGQDSPGSGRVPRYFRSPFLDDGSRWAGSQGG